MAVPESVPGIPARKAQEPVMRAVAGQPEDSFAGVPSQYPLFMLPREYFDGARELLAEM